MIDIFQPEIVEKINTLTKYPSIPTLHAIDPSNGCLLDRVQVDFEGQFAIVSEKIDGVNSRIIALPGDDYVLGSREEMLHARGDRVINPAFNIVNTLRPIAERLRIDVEDDCLVVFYLETFGHSTSKNSRCYAGGRVTGVRLFDVAVFPHVEELISLSIERIAMWRDGLNQSFANEAGLAAWAHRVGVELTPGLGTVTELPTTHEGALEFLRGIIPTSLCALDDSASKVPEGVVVRTADRRKIAKIRYQDYQRTLRRRQEQERTRK